MSSTYVAVVESFPSFCLISSAVRLYSAALQQIICLRTVLQEITGYILAGGFAAAQYKHMESDCSCAPMEPSDDDMENQR